MGLQNTWSGIILQRRKPGIDQKKPIRWIHGVWTVPNIALPLWTTNPRASSAASEGKRDGFGIATWIGIQSFNPTILIQVGVTSIMPASATAVSGALGGTKPIGQIVTAVVFDWPPASAVPVSHISAQPGDTMRASIEMASDGQSATVSVENLTQGIILAGTVTASEVGGTALTSRQTEAAWICEQWQINTSTVVPMARYGSVVFNKAVCGTGKKPNVVGPPYPDDALLPGRLGTPAGISDGQFSYITLVPNVPRPAAAIPVFLPYSPAILAAAQTLSGPGTMVSSGWVVADDVVACQYVYPAG
jgi:hypothetical protein